MNEQSVLDSIKQMQSEGVQDSEIIQRLTESGYSPRDIEDALHQAKIKAAVEETQEPQQEVVAEMAPGIMNQSEATREIPQQDLPIEQPQQQYYDSSYYSPQPGVSSETISEIAEQIVSEKINEIKKSLGNFTDFKLITEAKLSALDERLRKIESIISQLQMAVIRKVGDYGSSIQDIKSEMIEMQKSFSKVINPLVERARGKMPAEPVQQEQEPEEKSERKIKKTKDSFENYLR